MKRQQRIWEKEHKQNLSIPVLASEKPAHALVYFLHYLTKRDVHPSKRFVDIGCGKGRNTIYLARLGYDVYAMDYIHAATKYTRQTARSLCLTTRVHLSTSSIDKRWPYPDNFFDVALDNYSSIDIETKTGRKIYKKELKRTLKPGGYAVASVVSANDELEQTMNQGQEYHSTIWPNGKFQKNYDEPELREFYKDFVILEIRKQRKSGFKLGKKYLASNFWVILQKPS